MKRTFINIAAVLTALVVGLTINNACAEKIDSEDPADAPVTARFFVEDGLLFGPDGKVYNKLKSVSGIRFEDMIWGSHIKSTSYTYDKKGRLSVIEANVQTSGGTGTISVNYEYSELKVRETIVVPEDGSMTTEYYYHPIN